MNPSGPSIADRSRVRPNGRSFAQRVQSIEHDRRPRRHSHQIGCCLAKPCAFVRRPLGEDRAEAAIETFRSCFDAALAEGSSHERARLRQAASDLMRVAARTTIVLDRLNALSERAAAWPDPRSISNRRA